MLTPRALDEAVERRWPRLFTQNPRAALRMQLTVGCLFQITSLVLVYLGSPYSYAAAGPIGGTLGLLLGGLYRVLRRQE